MFLVNSCCRFFNKPSLKRGLTVRWVIQGPDFLKGKMGSTHSSKSYSTSNGKSSSDGENRPGSIKSTDPNENYVESVVCKVDDLKDNEMKVFDIGDEGKVLVVKQKGEFNAVGTKCTHYGAPLVSGALGDGRIRCQWHGACFNLKTGDIEDFPGFDSLPCYQVTVTKKGEVKVRAKVSDLISNKRIKDLGSVSPCDGSSVVIIGGGPSGATCAESLRDEGFTGRITLVCKEKYLPYDRIKVSKLGTHTEIEKLQARSHEYYKNANIDVIKGVEANKVDPEQKYVHLSNGEKLRYSSLYIATGSKARVPDDIPGVNLRNVFTLRNYDDSVNVLKALGAEQDKHVVCLGLSFIGLEAAAGCYQKAKSMTVVGTNNSPLGQVFGDEIGDSLRKLFEEKGIKFQFKTSIVKCNGEDGAITSVDLKNGVTLPADVLILGVGSAYYTDFLKNSGISLNTNGSVNVNDKLETNIKNIYAGGDIAFAPVYAHNNEHMSIGHIGLAQYHGLIAAKNIVNNVTSLRTVPYFWTMLFGKSIRYAGCGKPSSFQIEGDIGALKFVIFFFNESDKVISVASCMRDPVVSQFAEFLYQGKELYKKDLTPDPFAWTKLIN